MMLCLWQIAFSKDGGIPLLYCKMTLILLPSKSKVWTLFETNRNAVEMTLHDFQGWVRKGNDSPQFMRALSYYYVNSPSPQSHYTVRKPKYPNWRDQTENPVTTWRERFPSQTLASSNTCYSNLQLLQTTAHEKPSSRTTSHTPSHISDLQKVRGDLTCNEDNWNHTHNMTTPGSVLQVNGKRRYNTTILLNKPRTILLLLICSHVEISMPSFTLKTN